MSGREIVVLVVVAAGVVLVGGIILVLLWGLNGMWGFSTHMGGPGVIPILLLLLFCFAPLLLGGLLVGGAVWLLTTRSGAQMSARPVQDTCPNCGEVVHKNWNNCPNCGQSLRSGVK